VIYIRRSYKKGASARSGGSADTSDEVQLAMASRSSPRVPRTRSSATQAGHQSGRGEKRDGWQAVIHRVELGGVAGIVAYDVSRLARNARLVLNLHHALELIQADLKLVQLPKAQWSTAEGRFMLGQLPLAAQFQGDYDKKRMTDMTRATLEGGGHVGNDPFGYRTIRDGRSAIVRPRTLEMIEEEAAVVRRIWRDLPTRSTQQLARDLQREGVVRRTTDPWTKDAVKDIVRRGRFYPGNVVYHRGAEERESRHPAILDEATWATGRRKAADARIDGRLRGSVRHRIYFLSGVLFCQCGKRMHGQTRCARGTEWRYYLCRTCGARAIPADRADQAVLQELRSMLLPSEAVREELRRRLALPSGSGADEARARLEGRLERVKAQHEWGDIGDAAYLAKMQEARTDLALLPEPEKIITFDAVAAIAKSMASAIDAASPEKLKELVGLLVDKNVAAADGTYEIEFVAAARPFVAEQPDLLMAPPDGFEPPTPALGRLRSIH
jgi:DNA invertase Pin-like site-specific DNA recombinase